MKYNHCLNWGIIMSLTLCVSSLWSLPEACAEDSANMAAVSLPSGWEESIQNDMHHKHYQKVMDQMTLYIEKKPKQAEFYRWRGLAKWGAGQFDQASKDIIKAISVQEKLGDADAMWYLEKGVLYSVRGLHQNAYSSYDKALELAKKQGKPADFILLLESEKRTTLYSEGLIDFTYGEYSRAAWNGSEMIGLGGKPHEGLAFSTLVWGAMGEKKKAAEGALLTEAHLKEAQGDLLAAGSAYIRSGQYDKALECLSKEVAAHPQNDVAYSLRGIAYGLAGQYEVAVADFSKALDIRPNAEDYNNRGHTYVKMKAYDLAKADLEKAYAENSNDPAIFDSLGRLALAQGNGKEAVDWLTKSLALHPNADGFTARAKAYGLLGEAEFSKKDLKSAKKWAEKEAKGDARPLL